MAFNLQYAIQEQIKVLSDDEKLKVLVFICDLQKAKPVGEVKPIADIFADLSAEIPLEQWQELPVDGAANHDHYLYGAPKKEI